MKNLTVKTFFNNEFVEYPNTVEKDVYCPYDGKKLGSVQYTPVSEVNKIVQQAVLAQEKWGKLTTKKRADVLYKYRNLLLKYREELAQIIHLDNGKTMGEALAEVDKCVELTDFACSMPQLVATETQKVSTGIFCREELRPVGVCAVITPFNFPLMVPNWSIPNALVLGNAVILKPSELVPLVSVKFAEIWKEAGLPAGLFNVVHGEVDIGKKLAEHKDIKALTFVGSTPVAKLVYANATANNKRALCLGGAKNFVFALKDADPIVAAREILSSAVGMAGQRCMALSVGLIVGENNQVYDELIKQAKLYTLGNQHPPIVSLKAIENLKNYTNWAREQGAKVLVDGSKDFKTPENQSAGYWYGPTIIDWTGLEDKMGPHEVFGPLFEVVKVKNLTEGIKLQQKSEYGNSVSVFTQSGRAAEEVIEACNPGMIGVNIGVAVPREPFSFGGLNNSKFGYGDITGKSSIRFWTNLVKVSFKWNPENKVDWMS